MCLLADSISKTIPSAYANSEEGRHHAEKMMAFLLRSLSSGANLEYALGAYSSFCRHVLPADPEWLSDVQQCIVDGLKSPKSGQHLRGFALAGGCIDDSAVSEDVLHALLFVISDSSDVEVRRNAVRSLGRLSNGVSKYQMVNTLTALSKTMADYSVDDRGDVGSWVREASLESVACLFETLRDNWSPMPVGPSVPDDLVLTILRCILRQCCERIDGIRVKAGLALLRVHRSLIPQSRRNSQLQSGLNALSLAFYMLEVDQSKEEDMKSWCNIFQDTSRVFEVCTKLLHTPSISLGVLQGIIASAGGMGHQRTAAMSVLVSFGEKSLHATEKCDVFARAVSSFFISDDDRLVAPSLCVVENLVREGCLDSISETVCLELAARARKSWSGHLSDVGRTASAVRLLGELACLRGVSVKNALTKQSIEALVVVLAGVVPRLRRIAAEWLYLVFLELQEHSVGNGLGKAMNELCDTPWEMLKVLEARKARNELCGLVGVDKPVGKKVKKGD